MARKKRRMRLSEEDLEILLKMRGLRYNPYHIVNSNSTYRLTLTREEEDAVAQSRVERAFYNCHSAGKIVNNALQHIYKDYELNITLTNKITGEKTHLALFN